MGNFVWHDLDADGRQDAGEPGLGGIVVQLWNGAKTQLIDQTATNASGNYALTAPTPGDYRVRVVLPSAGDQFSPKDNAAAGDQQDNDVNPSGASLGFTDIYNFASNLISITTIDAGLKTVSPTRTPTATATRTRTPTASPTLSTQQTATSSPTATRWTPTATCTWTPTSSPTLSTRQTAAPSPTAQSRTPTPSPTLTNQQTAWRFRSSADADRDATRTPTSGPTLSTQQTRYAQPDRDTHADADAQPDSDQPANSNGRSDRDATPTSTHTPQSGSGYRVYLPLVLRQP